MSAPEFNLPDNSIAHAVESRWSAVHSGGHWWIADQKTGDLLEMIAGPEGEIAEAIALLHNSVDGIAWKPA